MKNNDKSVRKPSLKVWVAVLSAQMASISLGCTLGMTSDYSPFHWKISRQLCCKGWSGPALGDMARNDSIPHLTDESYHDRNMKTWIGSSMTLGALLGGIICGKSKNPFLKSHKLMFVSKGFCIHFLGYKKSMILLGIPNTLGWLLLW